jgi:hypothetical protein
MSDDGETCETTMKRTRKQSNDETSESSVERPLKMSGAELGKKLLVDTDKAPKLPKSAAQRDATRRVVVVLCGANLETVKIGHGKEQRYGLLNCDDHQGVLKKHNKNPADYRPDITHQCLLTLLDSPLNKAGRLQVYILTNKNVLIEVNPHVRIPRTYKRFAGLMGLHLLTVTNSRQCNCCINCPFDHLQERRNYSK